MQLVAAFKDPDLMLSVKLFVNVNLKIGFGYEVKGKSHAAAGSVVEDDVVAFEPQQPSAKIALTVDRLLRFQFCRAAGKPLVIRAFIKTSFETRGGYFQGVSRMDEVFDVENRSHV
jgi:hypothetical protein